MVAVVAALPVAHVRDPGAFLYSALKCNLRKASGCEEPEQQCGFGDHIEHLCRTPPAAANSSIDEADFAAVNPEVLAAKETVSMDLRRLAASLVRSANRLMKHGKAVTPMRHVLSSRRTQCPACSKHDARLEVPRFVASMNTESDLLCEKNSRMQLSSVADVQTFLMCNGFAGGLALNGLPNEATTASLRAFQQFVALPSTGKVDDTTRNAMRTYLGRKPTPIATDKRLPKFTCGANSKMEVGKVAQLQASLGMLLLLSFCTQNLSTPGLWCSEQRASCIR